MKYEKKSLFFYGVILSCVVATLPGFISPEYTLIHMFDST